MQAGKFRGFEVAIHDPGIAVLTFNQPERLNGMNHHIKRDQVETLLQAQMDYNAAEMTFSQSLDEIAAKTAVSDHHPDALEGMRAFQEKRAPRFNQWLEKSSA